MERIRDAIQKARQAREGESDMDAAMMPRSGHRGRSDPQLLGQTWSQIAEFQPDAHHFMRNRVVTMACEDPSHTVFDIMRTKILAALKTNKWRSVAITSPSPHCGKTLVSANLAFSFARLKEVRTVLIDLDLRRPQMARTLGLAKGHSVAAFLQGGDDPTSQFVRVGANLAICVSDRPQPFSAELLASSQSRRSLDRLLDSLQPDVVIYDMPPMMASDDTLAFLPNADCSLLIVEAEKTAIAEVDQTEQDLAENSNLLGVVLNKCRFETEKYGYYD